MTWNLTIEELANKLFATFSKKEDIEKTIETITSRYTILFNKIGIINQTAIMLASIPQRIQTGLVVK